MNIESETMDLQQAISAPASVSGLSCPDCGSHALRKHGTSLGIQRYRCKQCGRTFKETINTPLHWIHKKTEMAEYVTIMNQDHTIRSAALTLQISKNTSFVWRHKILSSLRTNSTRVTASPCGAVQITIPHSFKGKKNIPDTPRPASRTVLIADINGVAGLQMLGMRAGAIQASRILQDTVAPEAAIACTSTNILSRAMRITPRPEIQTRANKKARINDAKKSVRAVTCWMQRFHGVATKYLQQYWNWYSAVSNTSSSERFALECFGQRQLRHFWQIYTG